MGKLPKERLKPAPTWDSTALDFFGPFKVKDEVKKRMTGKAYGLIFNCLATRAVHIDVSPDYSTEKFLMVLQRFISIRGYPSKLPYLFAYKPTSATSRDPKLFYISSC